MTSKGMFENAALSLVQAISPGKRVTQDELPFENIRKVIENFVEDKIDDSDSRYDEDSTRDTSSGRGSSGDSQASTDIVCGLAKVSSTSSLASSRGSLSNVPSTSTYRPPKRIRKMIELREARRKASSTTEKRVFDCNEHELICQFTEWYGEQLSSERSSLSCFFVILNSLRDFFSRCTWNEQVDAYVDTFLSENIVRSNQEIGEEYERMLNSVCGDNSEDEEKRIVDRRIKDTEVSLLAELQCLVTKPKPIIDSDVLVKLRFLYIASDAAHMKEFLEAEITDTFALQIPHIIVSIYEELCVTVPADLEEYESPVVKAASAPLPSLMQPEPNSREDELKNMLVPNEDAENHSADKQKNDVSLSKKKKKPHPVTGLPLPATPRKDRKGDKRRSSRVIPDTPETKQKRVKTEEHEEQVVQQTPVGKMSRKKCREPLSQLIAESEKRARASRAAAVLAAQKVKNGGQVKTTKAQLFALNQDKKKQAKVNLSEKFAKLNSPKKPGPTMVTLVKDGPMKGFEVEKEVLEKYKQRITDLARSKKNDTSEVFYGRISKRVNLFEEVGLENAAKSRTGRVVEIPGSRVYIAHALLNVRNPQPLQPHKRKRGLKVRFKLRRLVRPASKSNRKKILRMRARIERQRKKEEAQRAAEASKEEQPIASTSEV